MATKIFLSDTAGLCSLEYQRSLPCGTGLLKMEAAGHAPCGVGGLMASGSWGASQAANCLVTQSQIFSLSTACGKEPFPQRRRVTCLKALETFLGLSHWGSLRVSPVQHHALPWCSGHCWPRAEGSHRDETAADWSVSRSRLSSPYTVQSEWKPSHSCPCSEPSHPT